MHRLFKEQRACSLRALRVLLLPGLRIKDGGLQMIVLAVDASTTVTGWAIMEAEGGKVVDYSSGFIDASKHARQRKSVGSRLDYTFRSLEAIASEGLDAICVEGGFIGQQPQVNMTIGYSRGIVYMLAARLGVAIAEYPPSSVKKYVAGHGHAKKPQVNYSVRLILQLGDTVLEENEADALAIALTHLGAKGEWLRNGAQSEF